MTQSGATQPTLGPSCNSTQWKSKISGTSSPSSTSKRAHRRDSSPYLEKLDQVPLANGASRFLGSPLSTRNQDGIGKAPITGTRPAPTNIWLKLTEQLVAAAECDSLRLSCSSHEA